MKHHPPLDRTLKHMMTPIELIAVPHTLKRCTARAFAAFLLLTALTPGRAQGTTNNPRSGDGYFADWFARVSRIQSGQPHWITPMTTVTPRLEEELRYDQSWESNNKGSQITSYGSGKGLELIPWDNIEVILGIPAWQSYNKPAGMDGFADDSFLLKYRIAAANEENGNYIVTAFLGLSVPSGKQQLTQDHYIVTPTLALGKGWGDFDVQQTLGVSIPDEGAAPEGSGTPLQINTALQYRLIKSVVAGSRSQLYLLGERRAHRQKPGFPQPWISDGPVSDLEPGGRDHWFGLSSRAD